MTDIINRPEIFKITKLKLTRITPEGVMTACNYKRLHAKKLLSPRSGYLLGFFFQIVVIPARATHSGFFFRSVK